MNKANIKRLYVIIFLLLVILTSAVLVSCGDNYRSKSVSVKDFNTDNCLALNIKCELRDEPRDILSWYKYLGKDSTAEFYVKLPSVLDDRHTVDIKDEICYIEQKNGDKSSYYAIYNNSYLYNQTVSITNDKKTKSIIIPLNYLNDAEKIINSVITEHNGIVLSHNNGTAITDPMFFIIDSENEFNVNNDIEAFRSFYNTVAKTTAAVTADNILTVESEQDGYKLNFDIVFSETADNQYKIKFNLIY